MPSSPWPPRAYAWYLLSTAGTATSSRGRPCSTRIASRRGRIGRDGTMPSAVAVRLAILAQSRRAYAIVRGCESALSGSPCSSVTRCVRTTVGS